MRKIGWDARILSGPHLRGMGTYAVHMLAAMRAIRPTLDVVLFSDQPIEPERTAGCEVRVVGPSRGYRWQLWEQVGLPWHAMAAGVGLLHSPANTTPRRSTVPRVVTLHDVIPYLPDVAGEPLSGRYWQRVVPAAVRSADAIITDSEHSRNDICRVFGVRPDRVVVVPLAVAHEGAPPVHVGTLPDELKLANVPFVLALAASARRKNTPGVLRAFAELAARDRDVVLVLTGVSAELRADIERQCRDLDVDSRRVRLLAFVDTPTRDALYARASAFLFLTLYEGFGLPILEAMRHGAPVVCSNRSSCPEVAGQAAWMVDPENASEAADAALELMRMSSDARDSWRARGHARAAQFSWERTARETLEVYERVTR